MEIKAELFQNEEVNINQNQEFDITDRNKENQIKLINNNKDEKIMKKSESNRIIRENFNKYNNFYVSKKNASSSGKIKIYKNKYKSPDINTFKQNNKNRLLLNVVYQKNNSYREEFSSSEIDNEYESQTDHFLINKNYLTDRESRNINNPYIYSYNNLSPNNNILHSNQIEYSNTFDNSQLFENKKNNYFQNINNANSLKVLKKSNSYGSIYLDKNNCNEINKFVKMRDEGKFEIIKIRFPRQHILNNNEIEYIPGKFEVINSNKEFMVNQFMEQNKNVERNNKQIINQENIIINNGFVNMNNNYYVNNNIKNIVDEMNDNQKDKIINNNSKNMKENIFNNNLYKDNNCINNDDEIINNHLIKNYPENNIDIKPTNNNNKYKNYKVEDKNILDNNYLFNQKLTNYNSINNKINKDANKNLNNNIININDDIINNLNKSADNNLNDIYVENKINSIYNINYINNTKFLRNLGNQNNYNYTNIPIYNNNLMPNLNQEMQKYYMKYNLNNDFRQNIINNDLLYNNKINKDIHLYNRNNIQIIPISKNINHTLQNNPQLFHPHFHIKNHDKYSSNLQIQCPVQMLVKKSKKNILARHKLITYYPQKVQIEIRPCYIFQDYDSQSQSIPFFSLKKNKIPLNYNYNDRIQFSNQILTGNIYNNKNELRNKRIIHNKVKRRRPVFKIPPCKKMSVSQGKSLNFIHKYYDENFILEEDDEEEKINKEKMPNTERKIKNYIKKNENIFFSDNEDIKIKNKIDFKEKVKNNININIINMENDKKAKEYKIELKIDNDKKIINENENNKDKKLINNFNELKNNIENIFNDSINNDINNINNNKEEISNQKEGKYEFSKNIKLVNENNTNSPKYEDKNDVNKKRKEKTIKKDNIILLNSKKLNLIKLGKESLNVNNNKKVGNYKKVKKRYNSINNNINKEYNTNKIDKMDKFIIEKNNRSQMYTLNNKKKNIKIINCDKTKNKFILKSNSFLGRKVGEVKNIERKLIPRIKQINSSLNSSYKKLHNKNKSNDRSNKNNDFAYKTNDKPRNIVVKIDLTKI